MSNYSSFGEVRPFEWNILPLSIFLYGVDHPSKAALYGNPEIVRLLQDRYREKHLADVCPAVPCGKAVTGAHWRDMVGGTFVRSIYLFRLKTSAAQDAGLVEEFNRRENLNRYNGFTRNCADFAASVVNRFFPGSAKADHLNDFWMTSPKAISKSFAHYGTDHPELLYSAELFAQAPGPMRRSSANRKGTEVGFRLKKWSIPLLLTRSDALIFFAGAYTLTGRFNADEEVDRHSVEEVSPESEELGWMRYREEFESILDSALHNGQFGSRDEVKNYFKVLDRSAVFGLDAEGSPFLRLGDRVAGLSAANLTAAGTDSALGYRIMIARVAAILSTPAKRRESPMEFERDWAMLNRMRTLNSNDATVAGN